MMDVGSLIKIQDLDKDNMSYDLLHFLGKSIIRTNIINNDTSDFVGKFCFICKWRKRIISVWYQLNYYSFVSLLQLYFFFPLSFSLLPQRERKISLSMLPMKEWAILNHYFFLLWLLFSLKQMIWKILK